MLVINRKAGEEILIGDNIRIRVLRINRGKISVGLEADQSVPIRRGELCRQPATATTAQV